MNELDHKLNEAFAGYVVRKDLVKLVRGNAAVPSYVLEYLLGQNCATDDEELIEAGVERVREILSKHYVQRSEAGLIRARIREEGFQRVIDRVSVDLNEKRDAYEATFENLGISKVLVDSDTVKCNERMLVSGVWCICDLSYSANEAKDESPFLLNRLKPIQMARFDFDRYCEGRRAFTAEEWIDALISSIGFDPDQMGKRAKLLQLTRLVTYCERNYNLVELGPKGTGKSHIFQEFSPHGMLISGGEVTPAKLFVNNSNGKVGLVGYFDVVAFDEFAGKNKKPKADIVDILKNYMANKSFSRGVETIPAEASMAFVGNTSHDVGYLISNADLFDDLPAVYHDPAFIDRLHAYIPGWEVSIIRGDMFSHGYGFISDYLAEALRYMRTLDYTGLWRDGFELSTSLSSRDRDGITKTFSGLMKLIFPNKDATADEVAGLLEFCMEMRERVKDQLYRIDETYDRVEFKYRRKDGGWVGVTTTEELECPEKYHSLDKVPVGDGGTASIAAQNVAVTEDGFPDVPVADRAVTDASEAPAEADLAGGTDSTLRTGLMSFRENQRGVSYESLFGAYLEGARSVEIVDPYVRAFHQCRNMMELLQVCMRHMDPACAEKRVHLLTCADEYDPEKQGSYLQQVADAFAPFGLSFSWDIDRTGSIHARHLRIDQAWDILLDRGLDIYQRFDSNNAFALEAMMPEMRRVKQFEVTYLRVGE